MRKKMKNFYPVASILLLLNASCAMNGTVFDKGINDPVAIVGQNYATGWFNYGTEWSLFSNDAFLQKGQPGGSPCITVVNNTGKKASAYRKCHGQHVIIKGLVIDYDDLPIGKTYSDKLLTKRYWNDILVPNFCISRAVVIANSVELR